MKYGFETAINQEKEAVQVEKNTLSNFEWQGVIVARGKAKDKLKLLSQLISSGRTVFFEYTEVNTSLWLNRSLIVRYVQKKTLSLCTVLKRIKYYKEETQHCPPSLYEIGNKLVTDVFEMTVLSHF